jgi:hypothetical protein
MPNAPISNHPHTNHTASELNEHVAERGSVVAGRVYGVPAIQQPRDKADHLRWQLVIGKQ